MKNVTIDRILWAVDPFTKEGKYQVTAGKALRTLNHELGAEIEFVTIVHPPEGTPVGEDIPQALRPPAEAKLAKWLRPLKWKNLPSLTFLVQRGVYLRADIDRLVSYARETKSDLIVASTHARKGVARFWLGSFAETLLLHSSVPLLLVNPLARIPTRYTKVLFPTDLSPESKKIFEKALPFLAALKVEVVLYHRVEEYLDFAAMGLTPVPVVRRTIKRELVERKKWLQAWCTLAEARGLKVRAVVDSAEDSLSEAILARAKSMTTGFVAMGSHSGAIAAFVLGSTARQVARAAPCPVWVLHS